MSVALPSPALIAAAPISSRNIMVWGDQAAMDAMRGEFERKGWRWASMSLGGQTNALLLIPPATIDDGEITQIIGDVNAGKFGQLNAGYAQVGSSADNQPST